MIKSANLHNLFPFYYIEWKKELAGDYLEIFFVSTNDIYFLIVVGFGQFSKGIKSLKIPPVDLLT
jgi:hypothetical protein